MTSLFPDQNEQSNAALVTIKAGMCDMLKQESGKYQVTPKEDKGEITLSKADGNYVVFKWTDRATKTVGFERVLFPQSIQFKKAKTGRDNDRIFYMKWNDESNDTKMFWLQDKNTTKDESLCKKFNDIIADPNAFMASERRTTPQNALLDLLRGQAGMGGVTPGSTPAPPTGTSSSVPSIPGSGTGTTAGSGGGIDFSSLFAAAGGLPPPPPSTSNNIPPPVPQSPPSRLEDAITSQSVISSGILNIPEVRDALVALLPSGQQDPAMLEANLRSPQLYEAMRGLTAAVNSNEYYSVFANLGVDASNGQEHIVRGDMVRALLAAIQASNPATTDDTSNNNEDDNTKMDE